MDYINFKINGVSYSQRNRYSKLIAILPDGTKKTYNNYNELSDFMQKLIKQSLLTRHYPEDYFKYKDIIGLDNRIYITGYHGTDLSHVVIPEEIHGKKVIGLDKIFKENKKVKTIIIPESVMSINEYFCYDATNLTYVNLPKSIKKIPICGFANCENLKFINLENIEEVKQSGFRNCVNLKSINIENLKTAEPHAFCNCEQLTSINAPNLTYLYQAVFQDCKNLKKVVLCDDLMNIGNEMFMNCIRLNDIKLPKNLKVVGVCAFHRCVALENIKLPKSLLYIDVNAFSYTGLKGTITFPDKLKIIEDKAFTNTNIDKVNISKNTQYNQNAFSINALTNLWTYDDKMNKRKKEITIEL